MHTLWAVHVMGGNGKELFGDNYADIWAMDRLHFSASSTGRCDQARKMGCVLLLLLLKIVRPHDVVARSRPTTVCTHAFRAK